MSNSTAADTGSSPFPPPLPFLSALASIPIPWSPAAVQSGRHPGLARSPARRHLQGAGRLGLPLLLHPAHTGCLTRLSPPTTSTPLPPSPIPAYTSSFRGIAEALPCDKASRFYILDPDKARSDVADVTTSNVCGSSHCSMFASSPPCRTLPDLAIECSFVERWAFVAPVPSTNLLFVAFKIRPSQGPSKKSECYTAACTAHQDLDNPKVPSSFLPSTIPSVLAQGEAELRSNSTRSTMPPTRSSPRGRARRSSATDAPPTSAIPTATRSPAPPSPLASNEGAVVQTGRSYECAGAGSLRPALLLPVILLLTTWLR